MAGGLHFFSQTNVADNRCQAARACAKVVNFTKSAAPSASRTGQDLKRIPSSFSHRFDKLPAHLLQAWTLAQVCECAWSRCDQLWVFSSAGVIIFGQWHHSHPGGQVVGIQAFKPTGPGIICRHRHWIHHKEKCCRPQVRL